MRKRYRVTLGIVIALVLAFSLWENQKSYGRRGRHYTTARILTEASRALQTFSHDIGRYPNSDEGLGALLKQPVAVVNWKGPYIRSEQLLDAWDHPFIYRRPAAHGPAAYELFSAGPNGIPDDGDDLFPNEKLFPK